MDLHPPMWGSKVQRFTSTKQTGTKSGGYIGAKQTAIHENPIISKKEMKMDLTRKASGTTLPFRGEGLGTIGTVGISTAYKLQRQIHAY